jgi:hypothetical protein
VIGGGDEVGILSVRHFGAIHKEGSQPSRDVVAAPVSGPVFLPIWKRPAGKSPPDRL